MDLRCRDIEGVLVKKSRLSKEHVPLFWLGRGELVGTFSIRHKTRQGCGSVARTHIPPPPLDGFDVQQT